MKLSTKPTNKTATQLVLKNIRPQWFGRIKDDVTCPGETTVKLAVLQFQVQFYRPLAVVQDPASKKGFQLQYTGTIRHYKITGGVWVHYAAVRCKDPSF